ncbi:glycosyltransferase [Nostoc sp. CENA67]|uniref:Glycosyltransferase n=1 Tax=Amazonocrinis nigriterrae CENA67 TaxID=2794033 RepID=A0A8J7I212_9NOST|nr:glycosyltransferase [Amazonocrinis nigriterrae]MBH8566849.1 glycosyltransferase [Amazonocrinis nigriterrae CENA67]
MKLNWFSPIPPAKTDIAEYTMRVIPALSHYAEVLLWTDQSTWNSEVEKYAKVCQYNFVNVPWAEINEADLNIYHIGNNTNFHYETWQISQQCPGLVILHDFKLQHFFTGIYKEKQNNQQAYISYISHMKRYYGVEGEQAGVRFWNGALTTEYMAEHYPLTFLALENAVGVVTHTKEVFHTLKQKNRWLVGYAPLPYVSKWQAKTSNKVVNAPYRLIIFGYIGPNRCLEPFLKALSNFPERDHFRLDIYGEVWDKNYICYQIQKLGLSDLVKLHGFVKESELDSALANAHLAVNLRYPTMGEASGSQLRIWSHALPSLVTQVGWYAEQPENTVAFVRPEHEIEDIQQHFRNFIANPELFAAKGKKGQQLLQEQHNPKIYAQAIISFAENSQKFRSNAVAFDLIEKVAEELSSWMNYEILNSQLEQIAEAIYFIGREFHKFK